MHAKLRLARPVTNLAATEQMYLGALGPLGLTVLTRFADHKSFDGVMLGTPGGSYHFEFTVCHAHPVVPAPTPDDLVVLYLPDKDEWEAACRRAEEHGFERVTSFNPYWEAQGRTFADRDGYRLVLQNAAWTL